MPYTSSSEDDSSPLSRLYIEPRGLPVLSGEGKDTGLSEPDKSEFPFETCSSHPNVATLARNLTGFPRTKHTNPVKLCGRPTKSAQVCGSISSGLHHVDHLY